MVNGGGHSALPMGRAVVSKMRVEEPPGWRQEDASRKVLAQRT